MTPVQNPKSFRMEARAQIVCAYCGKARPFQAHHVVDKGELKKVGLKGNALYDTRNALRLCEDITQFIQGRCHYQFENRRIRIATWMLKDCNIEYAFEVLGAYAFDYLTQEYVGALDDSRIRRQLELCEGAA
jgi:hypothetical protein